MVDRDPEQLSFECLSKVDECLHSFKGYNLNPKNESVAKSSSFSSELLKKYMNIFSFNEPNVDVLKLKHYIEIFDKYSERLGEKRTKLILNGCDAPIFIDIMDFYTKKDIAEQDKKRVENNVLFIEKYLLLKRQIDLKTHSHYNYERDHKDDFSLIKHGMILVNYKKLDRYDKLCGNYAYIISNENLINQEKLKRLSNSDYCTLYSLKDDPKHKVFSDYEKNHEILEHKVFSWKHHEDIKHINETRQITRFDLLGSVEKYRIKETSI